MVLLLSLAWAALIRPKPITCVPGSYVETNHSGTWCEPHYCGSAVVPCTEGECVPDVGHCVVENVVKCGGRKRDCTLTRTEVVGACSTQDDCSTGECTFESRCVKPEFVPSSVKDPPADDEAPPAVTPPTETPTSSSCGYISGLPPWVAGLLGAFLLVVARLR